MRRLFLLASSILILGCAPIESVVTAQARVPRNSGITLNILGPDPAGVEHAISSTLLKAGYQPYSGSIRAVVVTQPLGEASRQDLQSEQEITRKYQTPYLCQVKMGGFNSRVFSFSLQLIEVATGKILISISGTNGTYSGEDIAKALLEQLSRMGG